MLRCKKEKEMKKKALSFLLAAISAFSLVLPAFATTDTTEATVYIVDEKLETQIFKDSLMNTLQN